MPEIKPLLCRYIKNNVINAGSYENNNENHQNNNDGRYYNPVCFGNMFRPFKVTYSFPKTVSGKFFVSMTR